MELKPENVRSDPILSDWIFATGLVASAPGSEFWAVFDKIKNLNNLGEKLGKELRTWSGDFEPSE